MVLLLVDQDGLTGAGGGEADDAGATEGLSAEAGICARTACGTGGCAATASGTACGVRGTAGGGCRRAWASCRTGGGGAKEGTTADGRAGPGASIDSASTTGSDAGHNRAAGGACACDRLAEETKCLGLGLAKADGLPIILAGHWVNVFLPQEADLAGLHQRVHVGRISVELSVVELDGASVLLTALHGFALAVELDFLGDSGHGDRQRDGENHQQKNDPDEDVALFRGVWLAGWNWSTHCCDSLLMNQPG